MLSDEERDQLLLLPRKMFMTCAGCRQRQISAKHCRYCGMPRTAETKLGQYQSDEELALAVETAENQGLTREQLMRGKFCSSCGTPIAGDEVHCSACGNEVDASDTPVVVQKRGADGNIHTVQNPAAVTPQVVDAAPSENSQVSANYIATAARNDLRNTITAMLRSQTVRRGITAFLGTILLAAIVFALWPRTAQAQLRDTQYQPSIQIAYVYVEHGNCWENIDCPAGYQETARETRSYTPAGEIVVATTVANYSDPGEVQVGEKSETDTVTETTYGEPGEPYNCTENDEIIDDVFIPGVCTPEPEATHTSYEVTAIVPVYGTKTPSPHYKDVQATYTPHPEQYITYVHDVPSVRMETFGWISGTTVAFPEYRLNSELRENLTGNKSVDYQVVFTYKGSTQTVGVSETQWYALIARIGQTIEVNVVLDRIISVK